MSLIQICVLGTLSLALWKAVKLLQRHRTYGIDLDGPNRGNWLIGQAFLSCHSTNASNPHTGNIGNIFEGGVDYCVHIADKYGGALRLHGPNGVSSIHLHINLDALECSSL